MAAGQGVKLTKSEYRDALQAFAAKQSVQEGNPDVPRYLSDDPIQPVLTSDYLAYGGEQDQRGEVIDSLTYDSNLADLVADRENLTLPVYVIGGMVNVRADSNGDYTITLQDTGGDPSGVGATANQLVWARETFSVSSNPVSLRVSFRIGGFLREEGNLFMRIAGPSANAIASVLNWTFVDVPFVSSVDGFDPRVTDSVKV